MELFKHNTSIDFMGMRHWLAGLSIVVFIAAIASVYFNGLNFGLDFTGGIQIELRYEQSADTDEIRTILTESGFENPKVAHFGTTKDVVVRLGHQKAISEQALASDVLAVLSDNEIPELRRVDFVGSEVGEQLAEQGSMAVLVAMIATMIYIAMRFEYRFALSAAIALLHDPVIILGLFSLFQWEFDLATLAAVLAVMGYSINDTIVVYDRVRENTRKYRKLTTEAIMNGAINQTLSRTIMTSFMTLLVVIALLVVGGESLRGFSIAMTIGILVGTYSSIYVAGALALSFGFSRQDLMPKQRTTGEVV